MKNNKHIYKIACLVVLSVMAAVLAVSNKTQATVPPALGIYLAGIKNSDWAVMAQGALGQTPSDINFLKTIDGTAANDYATYILALTAIGKDPRSFSSENLVNSLRQKASAGQLGDQALLNDDMFGLLALVSAGVPASDALVQSEAGYIKSKQLSNGSWDFTTTAASGSTDMTAMGIMALRAAGVGASDQSLTKAVSYLSKSQNNDGGFPLLPGGASNTESTAWVLSALYALGDNLSIWSPKGVSPDNYLLAQIQSSGHAGFDGSSKSVSGRTPTTTAYAAVALAGKYYPVKIIPAPVTVKVNLRLEGKASTICEAQAEGSTALEAVQAGASVCKYTYNIENTQYGPYLNRINNDTAAGLTGWSFLINNQLASVGAADYKVKAGDNVLFYYGNWNDLPLRLSAPSLAVAPMGEIKFTVEKYDYNKQAWQAAPGTSLKRGGESWNTNSAGEAVLTWPSAGSYLVWAVGANLVRSPKVAVAVGAGSSQQQSLGMSVNITPPAAAAPPPPSSPPPANNPAPPAASAAPAPAPAIVFGVSGDLNFGTITAGASAAKTASLNNTGTANLNVTASVSGSDVFRNNLTLDAQAVPDWQKKVNKNSQAPVNVILSIPSSYSGSGQEQGSLIFWANVAP